MRIDGWKNEEIQRTTSILQNIESRTPAVHRKMDEWIHYLENGQSQYGYDHIHFDCPKQPLFRWNAIRQHLDAMMCSFNVIAMKSKETPFEFQLWAFIGVQKDFGIVARIVFSLPLILTMRIFHKNLMISPWNCLVEINSLNAISNN